MNILLASLLGVAVACAGVWWRVSAKCRSTLMAVLLAGMVVSTAVGGAIAAVITMHGAWVGAVSVLCVALAALGGAPLVDRVLRSASRTEADPIEDATPLAGGLWIGVAERISVAVSLMVGWPEGLLLVTAVKGVGRYPELSKAGSEQHYAEKFIIGSFFSLLWACGCAGIAYLAIR